MSDKLKKSLAHLIPDQRPSDLHSMSDIEFKSPLFSSLHKAQLATLSTHDHPTATAPTPFQRTLSNGHHDYSGHIHPSSSPNSYNHSSEKLETPHPNTINLYSSQPPNLSTVNIDYTRNANTNILGSITNQPKPNLSQHENYGPSKSNFKSSYTSTSAASNLKSQPRKTKSPILGRHKKQTPKRRQSFDDSRINFTHSFSKPTKVLYANHLTRYNKEYDRIAKIYGWHSSFDKENHSRLHFRLPTWLKTPKMQKEYQSTRANDISIGHPVLVKVDSSYGEAPLSSLAGKGRNGIPGPAQLSIKTDVTQWRPHARSISSPDDMLTEIYGDSEELHKIVFSNDTNTTRHRRSASDDASERADGPNSATSPVELFLSNQTDHLHFNKLDSQDNHSADYLDQQYDYFARRRDASESPSADMLNDDEDNSDDKSDEPSARSLPSERFHPSSKTSTSPVPGSLNKPLPAAPRAAERSVYPTDTKQPAKFTYKDDSQHEEEKSFGLPPSDHPFWISPKVFDLPDSSSNIQYEVTKKMGFSMTGTGNQQVSKTKKLIGGTAVKLVEVLTTTLDYTFLLDFFVIYRMFMSPVQLAKLLILRFRWGMLSESDERCLVRMRTFIVLRHWISEFYNIDFVTSRPLRVIVITFINELSHNPTIRASVRDLRIVKTLKKLVKKHDSDYKLAKDLHASSGCSLSLTDWLWQQEIIREYEPLSNAVTEYIDRKAEEAEATGWSLSGIGRSNSRSSFKSKRLSTDTTLFSADNVHGGSGKSRPWPLRMTMSLSNIKRSIVRENSDSNLESVPENPNGFSNSSSSLNSNASNAQNQIQSHHPMLGRSTSNASYKTTSSGGYENSMLHRSLSNASTSSWLSLQHTLSSIASATSSSNSSVSSLTGSHLIPSPTNETPPSSIPPSSLSTSITLPSLPPLPPSTTNSAHTSICSIPSTTSSLHRENSQSKEKRFKSFILNYKSEVIAQQFTLIEQTALRCIKWTELLDDNWKSNQDGSRKSASGQFDATNETGFTLNGDDGNEWIGGIKSMIDRFNLTCQWIATEICSTKNFDERVKVIEKLIRIALKCHHLHNYSTCTAIILGLQNPQVDRLKKTWNKVSAFEKKAFKDLIGFISPCKNFSGLREAMKTVCENAGGLAGAAGGGESSSGSTDDGKGVPFVGLYLSDLVFNNELPTYLPQPTLSSSSTTSLSSLLSSSHNNSGSNSPNKSNALRRSHYSANSTSSSSSYSSVPIPSMSSASSNSVSMPPLPIINFHKFRIMASIITQFREFQNEDRKYQLPLDVKVYSKCLCLNAVSNDELKIRSLDCEGKDGKK